jgi:predicted SAM-dependent methyltransferase
MKLHLGCGKRYLPGWFHVDFEDHKHVDHVGDIADLSFIPSGTVEEIYICHTLEHIPPVERYKKHRYEQLDALLVEFWRVLQVGGILRIAVPDFDSIVKVYNPESIEMGFPLFHF